MITRVVGDLLLFWQGDEPILDEEWADAMTIIERHEIRELKVFVITFGGAPSVSQQLKLARARGQKLITLAVVSHSAAVRFVASSIALFTKHIRTFTPQELPQALAFLTLTDAQRQAARGFASEHSQFPGTATP